MNSNHCLIIHFQHLKKKINEFQNTDNSTNTNIKMDGKKEETMNEDNINNIKQGCILRFKLGKSIYATMLLREACFNESTTFQKYESTINYNNNKKHEKSLQITNDNNIIENGNEKEKNNDCNITNDKDNE